MHVSLPLFSPSPSLVSLSLNRFCVFSETLAARQLCPFWVMTSSAAGRPGCSASVPKRVWWLARRCVSRNTLYPNADLIRPDCSPSYFIQNRERGGVGSLGGGGRDQGLKMKLKQKPQLDYVYRQGKVPVLSAFSMRIVLEWHPADGWEKESASLNFTWSPSLFLFLLIYTLWITLNTHIVLHYPDHHNALWFSIRSDIRNSSTFNLIWIFCINSPHPNVSTYNTTEKKKRERCGSHFFVTVYFGIAALDPAGC